MTRRLLFSYLSITAFVLLILEVPLALTFARSERDRLTADLERDARVLATRVEDTLEGRRSEDLQQFVDDYRQEIGGRVVVVDADGISVADSDNTVPRDFSTRPEIETSLRDAEVVAGSRHSDTLDETLLYVTVPVASGGSVYGAVRITYPTTQLDRRVHRNWISLAALGGVVLASVGAVGFVLARSVTRPVRALGDAASRLAAGDLSARAPTNSGPPEVRALADEFNDMAARLEELVGSQRAFVADASHELRTPLTALRLRLENLQVSGPQMASDDLDGAAQEVARLARLVEGLLGLARAEGTRPEREVVDVGKEASERVDVWRALAEEQSVQLLFEARGDGHAIAARGAVTQILDNLLANALDVATAGSAVQVRTALVDGTVELHVIDAGPGLTDEERRRAFDRFWRGPDSRSMHGSGLGLAIVAQLAHASGGDACLLPGPDGGIDARVRFPSTRPEPGAASS